jgi:hypothetical protein
MRREQAEQRPAGKEHLLTALLACAACGLSATHPSLIAAAVLRLRAREPIFSGTHTNEFCGIGKSTPEPAGPCGPLRPGRWVHEKGRKPLCGGDVGRQSWHRHLSAAAFAGRCRSHFIHRRLRVVPYGLPGCRRLRRTPPQHRCCPCATARGFARHLGRLCRRKGIPHVRRGVGYVGAWRLARPL